MPTLPRITRRTALKTGGLALFAAASGPVPVFLGNAAAAARSVAGRPRVLVTLFQRFGMDGVLAVCPYGDPGLARLRPGLMLSPPGSGRPDARLDLDGQLGLHPAFAPLLPLFQEGELGIVHAAGSPHPTRAHAEAQLWWESGAPGDRSVRSGWLNRALGVAPVSRDTVLGALAVSDARPRILYGDAEVATVSSLDELGDLGADARALGQIESLYRDSGDERLRASVSRGLRLSRLLAETRERRRRAPELGYPEGSTLGASLCEIAHLIKLDVGLRVAFAESGSSPDGKGTWDTHSNAASLSGPFPPMARDLARSLAAFWADLGPRRDDVALVTLTDFGRNVVENDRLGADHGRATAMFVLGGAQGGRVQGELPASFERDALEDGMDLPVTTDFRAVIAPLVRTQLGVEDTSSIFPGWTQSAAGPANG